MPNYTKLIGAILLAVTLFSATTHSAMRSYQPAPSPGVENALELQTVEDQRPPTVAIVLWNGVQIIDYSGPWEVFGQAGFKVFTVAEKSEPVTTAFGQRVTADFTFENAPGSDVLLVPGGGMRNSTNNPKLIKWVQDRAKESKYVMSVCTGAFILAQAGLLDGLTATTFHSAIDRLTVAAPKTKVVYDQRYVDNGKVITTAGLSSGIDGALYLVGKILGQGFAQSEAYGLEYRWMSDAKYARAAFADRYLPAFDGLDGVPVFVDGDTEHWQAKFLITKPTTLAEVLEVTQKELATNTPHKSSAVMVTQHGAKGGSGTEIEWKFTDDLGRPWVGSGVIEPSAEKNKFNISLQLMRVKLTSGTR